MAMNPAPMLARVTARFCWISISCSSALRRFLTSASREAMAALSRSMDGIFSALGIKGQRASAVTSDTAAVPALVSACRP